MSSKTFHYPPYNRFTPWREDADYRVAVVSPVGNGPKGDPLKYSDLTDDDKLDLARALITSGIKKGDTGDTGLSAFEVAQEAGFEGTVEEWLTNPETGIKGAKGDYETMSQAEKEDLANRVGEARIRAILTELLPGIGQSIANNALNLVYPVDSLFFTMDDDANPANLFGGTWEQLEDRFLYASANEDAGTTGGTSGSIILEANQLPPHTHPVSITSGSHSHVENDWVYVPRHDSQAETSIASWSQKYNQPGRENSVIYNKNRRKNGAVNKLSTASSSVKITGNTSANVPTGGQQSISIMPPYITVHVWKRKTLAEVDATTQETVEEATFSLLSDGI